MEALIESIMKTSDKIPSNICKYLVSCVDDYRRYVFTSKSAEQSTAENYEFFELLGDSTINKFVIWYFSKRFTTLGQNIPPSRDKVAVIATLRIKYVSKAELAKIAVRYGFWPFIVACDEEKKKSDSKLLEDTLEAFIGLTEYLIENKYGEGRGYLIVKYLLETYYDSIDITDDTATNKDCKSKLKEFFDRPNVHNGIEYVDNMRAGVTTIVIDGRYVLAEFHDPNMRKKERQKRAAEIALRRIEENGDSLKFIF